MVTQYLNESLHPMVDSIATELVAKSIQNSDAFPSPDEQQVESIISTILNEQLTQLDVLYNKKIQLLTNQLALNKKLTVLGFVMLGFLVLILL